MIKILIKKVPAFIKQYPSVIDYIAKKYMDKYVIKDLNSTTITQDTIFLCFDKKNIDILLQSMAIFKGNIIFLSDKTLDTQLSCVSDQIRNLDNDELTIYLTHLSKNTSKQYVKDAFRLCRKDLNMTNEYCIDYLMEKIRYNTIKAFITKKESYCLTVNIRYFCYWCIIVLQDLIDIKMGITKNIANKDFFNELENLANQLECTDILDTYKFCISYINPESELNKLNVILFIKSVISFTSKESCILDIKGA